MGNKKLLGKLLKHYKGYSIFEERKYSVKGVITETNLCVYGKKNKKLKQGCKNQAEAIVFIDALKS